MSKNNIYISVVSMMDNVIRDSYLFIGDSNSEVVIDLAEEKFLELVATHAENYDALNELDKEDMLTNGYYEEEGKFSICIFWPEIINTQTRTVKCQ